ncbi:MAG: hypothetical protein K9J37_14350 [Saprospiraceae bacterium]|nr:hypothetical protein [Saprospiraceae bacterium]MCF8251088.1 hypothetical protein [Saprospiraceae bacterium]MCF8280373.1 hypothetical protein [Bacteroidales bacterium]MCF8312856.1 hypothetical protein [Saprospiraceae bacterium]MCF8441347.1 hypothetical protein [Saprospiraceae bacterium]
MKAHCIFSFDNNWNTDYTGVPIVAKPEKTNQRSKSYSPSIFRFIASSASPPAKSSSARSVTLMIWFSMSGTTMFITSCAASSTFWPRTIRRTTGDAGGLCAAPDMAEETARYGEIRVRRPNRIFLLKIRAGEFEYEELQVWAEEKIAKIEELYTASNLPDSPDMIRIEEILVEIRTTWYQA